MRSPVRRPGRLVPAKEPTRLAVTVVAVLLGFGAAYAFLSADYFKAAPASPVATANESLGGGAGARQQQQGRQQRREQGQEQGTEEAALVAGDPEESAWFDKLDKAGCRNTEELRVCSHRARSQELADAFPGSLAAYEALWKAHVKCFDIDFVTTADGHLLAAHPDDLQQALPAAQFGRLRETVSQYKLADIRAAGADEERYPTFEPVLQLLARLIEEEEDKFWLKDAPHLDYARLPGIFMDLKEPAFTRRHVQRISAVAGELGITPHVALFVMSDAQEALAQQAGFRGPLIRGYLDKVEPDPPLTAELVAPYAMLGPSINMADAFFHRALALERPVHAWTVDTPQALFRGLEMGVDSVISNQPLAVRHVLFDWRDRCSDQL